MTYQNTKNDAKLEYYHTPTTQVFHQWQLLGFVCGLGIKHQFPFTVTSNVAFFEWVFFPRKKLIHWKCLYCQHLQNMHSHFLTIINKPKLRWQHCLLHMKMKSSQKNKFSFFTRRQTLMRVLYYMILMHFLSITLCICLQNPSHNHWLILIKTQIKFKKQD